MTAAKQKLIIVESPAKARTISKFLGKGYKVEASQGHVCDLPKSQIGVDVEHNFEPRYITIRGRGEVLERIRKEAKGAKSIILATDPDREGEAISWHLATILGIDPESECRVEFNEITEKTVKSAIKQPRAVNMQLVNAQQARRLLDRLVGYKISPLLWVKIKKGLSAGRVQSVATRMVVDREEEIEAFQSQEYWLLDARLNCGAEDAVFTARFHGKGDKKQELRSKAEVDEVINAVQAQPFTVSGVKRGEKQKSPAPPFITSTLQQEASRRLSMTPRRTMSIAQQLYEGVEISGHGSIGLITYMRTDSLRLSEEALAAAKDFIIGHYGPEYYPGSPRHFKTKAGAQDAHEAIRPTDVNLTPELVRKDLTQEQYRLYRLIWGRFTACQMANAKYDNVAVEVSSAGYTFRATYSEMKFKGFTAVYEEAKDEESSELANPLPSLSEGQALALEKLIPEQQFTQPPARFTEATLIRAMEEKGIGRPSTYAMIIDTLQARGYASLEKSSETSRTKVFVPSEQGELTDQKLQEYFSSVINVSYTADMEAHLDEIAGGKRNNIEELQQFWDKFDPLVQNAYDHMEKRELERTGELCPECGSELVYRNGRYGKFVSCINFPKCRYTKSEEEPQESDEVCPNCGARMVMKKGRYGSFLACSNYPQCKTIKSLKEKAKPEPTGEMCPECGHELVRRKSRYGTTFVGCSNYPKCRYIKKEPKAAKQSKAKKTESGDEA